MTVTVTRLKRLCVAFLIATLTWTGSSHAQTFLKGLEAMWLFDEGKGKSVKDSSGNGHHGDFRGKPEFIEGKFGTALDFGGPEEGDWIQMDAPVVVDTVDFTIGLWMKPAKPQNCWGNVISSRDHDGGDAGIAIAESGCLDNWYRIIIGGVINWDGVGNPRNTVRPHALEWNHVVFVLQGREGIWYLNGEPDRPKRGGFYIDLGTERPVGRSRENFRIATAIFNEGRSYKGALDEAFIFKRALTQLEVTKVMEKGLIGAQAVDAKDKIATVWGRIKT